MTENEIKMAQYLRKVVLPKLQEMQRDFYLDIHIGMDIEMSSFKKCIRVFVQICTDANGVLGNGGQLCSKSFGFHTFSNKGKIDKELRGISHFIENWQQRLA